MMFRKHLRFGTSIISRCIHAGALPPGVSSAFRAAGGEASAATLPLTTGRERLVILGTGWGAARLTRDIDPRKYDITVLSPRNHMVFTPLLASTCIGTLEPRGVCQAIADLQPALKQPQNFYYAASAMAVHPNERIIEARSEDGLRFFVEYDILAISTGSQGSTFGIPGVEKYACFLRDASHTQIIRSRLMTNWSKANIPGRSISERDKLLHCVVVGGGPTGVEFAGELADFINRDLSKIDNDRARDMRITLIEANELLGSFDARLREYAARKLVESGVHLVKGVVKEVREDEVELESGEKLSFGIMVWSTGVGPTEFTLSLPFSKTPKGRLAVDDHLRVLGCPEKQKDKSQIQNSSSQAVKSTPKPDSGGEVGPTQMDEISITQDEEDLDAATLGEPYHNIFALGDCCANAEHPLPALAQVAEQQGKYLAKHLNEMAGSLDRNWSSCPPFVYRSMGSMATVGGRSAVLELNKGPDGHRWLSWAGFSSWIAWRSAYLTRLGTFKARLYVATNWTITMLFGRDISRW